MQMINEHKIALGKRYIKLGLAYAAGATLFAVFYVISRFILPQFSLGSSIIHWFILAIVALLTINGLLGILAGWWEINHAQLTKHEI